MNFNSKQVYESIPDLVITRCANDRPFSQISSAEKFERNSLIFISDKAQKEYLRQQHPSVVITTPDIADDLKQENVQNDTCIITVSDVRLAQAIVKSRFAKGRLDHEWQDIHPSAVIHPSAQLSKGVKIGPNCVIGKNVVIQANTHIRANCVIERDVSIGHSCVIHSLVNINLGSTLGNRIVIRPGAIIGAEGFGFAQDRKHQYHHIPHSGIVEIHDDAQIGSNCNIDRGTYGKTIIGRGVKIDALCHVAHNVSIDENSLFVAQTGVAGSTRIGKRVIASGQTGMLDHLTIVDDVVMVHRSAVTEDIKSPGMWAGTPVQPFREYVRNLGAVNKLKKVEQRLNDKLNVVEEKLARLEQLEQKNRQH